MGVPEGRHVVYAILWALPMLAVLATGLVLALTRWERAPRAALCAGIASGIMLLLMVTGPLVHFALARGMGTEGMARGIVAFGVVRSVVTAAAWGLLLAGVFMSRPGKAPVEAGRTAGGEEP